MFESKVNAYWRLFILYMYIEINWSVWQYDNKDIVCLFSHYSRMLFFYLDAIELSVVVVVVFACLVKVNLEISYGDDIERCWWIEIGDS